ncbi:hypothetical protein [Streptomyces asiaticus]|uniref:hypothetical protein n=1 Tax=Streptomyces asiaticus TaxID=114695 RepID=UPI003F66FE45
MNGWDWIEEGQRIAEQSGKARVGASATRPRPCREDGFCDAVYAENWIGGQARNIVAMTAKVVGVKLGPNPLDGNTWSARNMMRVVEAARELANANEVLRKELAGRDRSGAEVAAALREALAHLGECV